MTNEEIYVQLERAESAEDFVARTYELTDTWRAAGYGVEAVDPILLFIETHPNIDYGTPGPLVHFAESFYRKGYEQKLIQSVKRKPTPHTVWMLNSLINGTTVPDVRRELISVMEGAKRDPSINQNTAASIDRNLKRLRGE